MSNSGDNIFQYIGDTATWNKAYDTYFEESLQYRRFKHLDLESLIVKHKQANILNVNVLGQSVKGKNIYKLTYGSGPKKVMLWSQMHGNEATATLALLDIFNFLEGKDDEFDEIRGFLKENTNLHFIPMLNPDGADKFVRRNALDIDLNRDARMGGTQEGNLLMQEAEKVKPDFGFNLHDQNIYYNVPNTPVPVSIALLAPAYNREREINHVRKRAMLIAAGMDQILQQIIPGAVARYDDEYTPRGFGDNFQSWGASTVLIESGGFKGDPEKQVIRKLNFIIILNALLEIATDKFEDHRVEQYESIPYNASFLTDVILRGVQIKQDDYQFVTDLSIKRSEVNRGRNYYVRSSIDDLGDLQDVFGYDEAGVRSEKGLQIQPSLIAVPGKTFPNSFKNITDLTDEKILELLNKGFTSVRIEQIPDSLIHQMPLVVLRGKNDAKPAQFRLGSEATFLLQDPNDGRLKFALVNGYLVDLNKNLTEQFGPIENRIIRNLVRN